MDSGNAQARQGERSPMGLGLVFVVLGVVLLGRQHEWWSINVRQWWPLIFVGLAVTHVTSLPRLRAVGEMVYLLILTAIFLMHNFGVLPLRDSWPLFIVAAGVWMLFIDGRWMHDGPGGRSRRPHDVGEGERQ